MKTNKIKQTLKENKISYGVVVQMPSIDNVEITASCGYDFVWIDCEHGIIDESQCIQLVRSAEGFGLTSLVRMSDKNNSGVLQRLLDVGVNGIIVQGVESKDEVTKFAMKMKFPPAGHRGACPGARAYNVLGEGMSWDEFTRYSNQNTMLCILIESKDGVDNIDEILSVPGIDMVVLGPFDMSHSLGVPGQWNHPDVINALTHVSMAAKAKGIPVMYVPLSPTYKELKEEVDDWIKRGCTIMSAALDTTSLKKSLKDIHELLLMN